MSASVWERGAQCPQFVFINTNKGGYLLLHATLTQHIYFTNYILSYANGNEYWILNILPDSNLQPGLTLGGLLFIMLDILYFRKYKSTFKEILLFKMLFSFLKKVIKSYYHEIKPVLFGLLNLYVCIKFMLYGCWFSNWNILSRNLLTHKLLYKVFFS